MQETPIVGRQPGRVLPVESLTDYFRTSIGEAIARQGVDVDPHAAHYVVNLMALYARSEQLYELQGETYGLRPLALMLADAADAASPGERNHSLRRIGDISLFVAGFFSDSLASAAVDVDYYVRMGGMRTNHCPKWCEVAYADGCSRGYSTSLRRSSRSW